MKKSAHAEDNKGESLLMKKTKNFASRWGFILASVGSAVGMANVWGFPNKLGSNGGGAFLLIYLLFVFIFSYVGLPAEFAMGRRARTGTLGTYESAWATRGKGFGKAGGILGWLSLAGSLCIAIGYAVIVTYILKALVDSLVGTLMTADTAAWFGEFSSTPMSVVPYHIIVVAGTLLTLYLGAHSIEKTNKIMMPLFFLIFIVLAVRVAFLHGAAEHLRVKLTDMVEVISLRRDLDTLHKILPVHAAAHKGELHPDRSIMGVIHIAESFKDRRLVVRLCKLIIHILELDTLRPGVIVQLAQAVRVHLAER